MYLWVLKNRILLWNATDWSWSTVLRFLLGETIFKYFKQVRRDYQSVFRFRYRVHEHAQATIEFLFSLLNTIQSQPFFYGYGCLLSQSKISCNNRLYRLSEPIHAFRPFISDNRETRLLVVGSDNYFLYFIYINFPKTVTNHTVHSFYFYFNNLNLFFTLFYFLIVIMQFTAIHPYS